VVFSVPEDKVAQIKVGSAVDVKPWSSATVMQGAVREVAASADPVTRTFLVKVSIQNSENLALGTTVTVTPKALDRSGPQVIKLPTSAFFQDGGKASVWVLDATSMTVHAQPVQIATADGNDVVVVGGLTPGMRVVSAGVHVLSPGQKVTIYKEADPAAPANPAQDASKSVASGASAPSVK
jgi:RND family efflux transporter MFP subunit